MTISGVNASLKWGYHEAASLSSWTVIKNVEGWSFTATASSVNTFRCSQRPIVFVAPHAKGVWRWDVQTLQIEGASASGTLGPRKGVSDVQPDSKA